MGEVVMTWVWGYPGVVAGGGWRVVGGVVGGHVKVFWMSLFIILWERRIVLRNHNCQNRSLSI